MNAACAYSCTTGMLEVARERGVEDQRVFKVILGVRKLIKTFSRQFTLTVHGNWDTHRVWPNGVPLALAGLVQVRVLDQVLSHPSFPSPRGEC